MIGLMSFMTIVVILAVALVDVITIHSDISSYFFFIAALYTVFIFGYWDNLKKAAILMKTVGNFIS